MSTVQENRREAMRILRRRRRALAYRWLGIGFVALLAVFALLNIFGKKKTFSEAENRTLADFPALTWESVVNGDFMTKFEDYVADQFFARNGWIDLKFWEDMVLGKKESNGVYLGKDGYLMEVPEEPDMENMKKNLQSMADFADRHADAAVYASMIPNSFYIMEEKLPYGAPVRDQAADISGIYDALDGSVRCIDVSDTLRQHAQEYIYYKTDHHWTSLGASYAFEDLAEQMGLAGDASYEVYTVANDFEGTLASRSGDHRSSDTVQIFENADSPVDYVVLYVEEGEKTSSIYDSESLENKDKYTVFFGGNHARVDITTTGTQSRNLLLFKDSYANCMVQFLLPYFRNIIMVDPRYFYDNVDLIMETQGITDVLFLYNVNTFVKDRSIADVLAAEAE